MQPRVPYRTLPISRRAALTVLAAGAGAVLPGTTLTTIARPQEPAVEWRGRALGSSARIVIRHFDADAGGRLLKHCVREIERLENIFSLYRHESELCRLNRDGKLEAASLDLRLVLAEARRFGELSDGIFDVTIQPLWRVYAEHFASAPDAASGPDRRQVDRAAKLVDFRAIDIDSTMPRLTRDGMAISLNGIAQGYFTDRIADLLRNAGMAHVLVDVGEIRVIGSDDDGPWRIGIRDPATPAAFADTITLTNAAVATSGGYGTRFDAAGRFHHLFDPGTGECPNQVRSATAIARTAMQADALATALAVSPPGRARYLLGRFRGTAACLILADGSRMELKA